MCQTGSRFECWDVYWKGTVPVYNQSCFGIFHHEPKSENMNFLIFEESSFYNPQKLKVFDNPNEGQRNQYNVFIYHL